MLEQAGLRRPAAAAVVDGRHRLTYADLVDQATRLGHAFARLGVGKGDRVLIVLKNRLEHVLAYWALQMIGGVPTPAGFRLAAREVRYILDDCGASVVLFEAATADAVQEAAAGHQARLVFVGDDEPAGSLPFDELLASGATGAALDRELAEGDLSLILYTSGTTGRPKGVPRTHRNHVAGALAHVIQCGYGWLERTLGVMPLYHTMGIHSLTSMAAVNGCFVCQPDWSGEGALALIESERLTALYLIPTLYYDLVRAPGFAPARVSSVRPGVDAKPGCAGRAGVHGTLRVVTASAHRRVGPDEAVAPGEKGEIIARLDSDEAFAGYWKRPDADARALRDGWYFTGDMGYLDEAGDLFVAGRVDDMIITGGENIHPAEVEEVMARHPRVRDVAVIGEPDDKWGERVVAFVVPADAGLTADALDRHCLDSPALANFKRPRRIVFVAAIPRTASGKILRRLLRDGHYVEVSK